MTAICADGVFNTASKVGAASTVATLTVSTGATTTGSGVTTAALTTTGPNGSRTAALSQRNCVGAMASADAASIATVAGASLLALLAV